MSKYNKTLTPQKPDAVNRAGGEAFTESPEVALVNLLLTSFQKDKFYETSAEETERFGKLLSQVDPRFAAKAAIYARKEFGMRSITHFASAWIAKHVKGARWTKAFFASVVERPDDLLEILACYRTLNGDKLHPIPNSLKRGLAAKLPQFGVYRLAKYKGDGKEISMIDAVNLVHPRATPAISKLMKGELETPDTWETAISNAGKSEGEVEENKAREWARLIMDSKLGYMALIRNIRNICEAKLPDFAFYEFVKQLTAEESIQRSRVFPFQILIAYLVIKIGNITFGERKLESGVIVSEKPILMEALSDAMDHCLGNVPDLPGRTLIALDRSGSMATVANEREIGKTPIPVSYSDIGAVFAAALAKKGADLMIFSDNVNYVPVNPKDTTIGIAERIPGDCGGTNFHAIFRNAHKPYDRIIIISDMQAWVGYQTPKVSLQDYKDRTGANPHLFCFNLASYGDTQFPDNKVYQLAGFSDKAFKLMDLLSKDRMALVHEIEAIELP